MIPVIKCPVGSYSRSQLTSTVYQKVFVGQHSQRSGALTTKLCVAFHTKVVIKEKRQFH